MASSISGLDATYVQRMARGESLHQGDDIDGHGAQDGDVKDLVGAAPEVQLARSEALRSSRLPRPVRSRVRPLHGKRAGTRTPYRLTPPPEHTSSSRYHFMPEYRSMYASPYSCTPCRRGMNADAPSAT